MSDQIVDVAVIGAGPAGATTSLFLSKLGIPHILFDKENFPRDKICGDALSGKSVSILKRLDPALVEKMENSPDFLGSWGVRFVAPNGKALDIPFKKNPEKQNHAPGFLASRLNFDHFLIQNLQTDYADFRQRTPVTGIEKTPQGMKLYFDHNGKREAVLAKMIVGAGGDRSIVRNVLTNYKMDRKHYSAGLRTYYENVSGFNEQNFIELHFLREILPGYLWIFPLPNNRVNVGIGMLSGNMKNKQISLKKIMLNALKENPNIRDRFKNARIVDDIKGWGLPLGSVKRELSGERFLLTGDAASLIDPFTGEGIGNAMLSGMIAAQWLKQAIERENYSASFLKGYDKEVYQELWDELKLSSTLQKLVHFPWLFNFVVDRALSNKTVSETLSCMFDDLNMRAKLRSPSFYLKMIFNT